MELNPPNHYNKSTRIFGDRGLLARPIIIMAGNFSRVTVRAKLYTTHTRRLHRKHYEKWFKAY